MSEKEEQRPSIPAELRRQILIEAGHRCAIPTCRNIVCDIHHIIPWEKCKEHNYENLIALCLICHRRADNEEIDRKSLRTYKANLRYIHEKFSHFEIDMLFGLYNLPPDKEAGWPPFLMLLIERLLDSEYVERIQSTGKVTFSGLNFNPDRLRITAKGREFIESLGLEHDW